MRTERKRSGVDHQGHWLASIMFGGPGSKKAEFPHAPVMGGSENNNIDDLRWSDFQGENENGKKEID